MKKNVIILSPEYLEKEFEDLANSLKIQEQLKYGMFAVESGSPISSEYFFTQKKPKQIFKVF